VIEVLAHLKLKKVEDIINITFANSLRMFNLYLNDKGDLLRLKPGEHNTLALEQHQLYKEEN
jgi:hypothetical protein